MAIKDYSSTAADNTTISGISIQGTADVKNFDNAMRQQLADIANWTDSDTLASASTTDLGSVEGMYVSITGTTTITAFGTLKAGMAKLVKFSGALTLTYNATSLVLPGAANIATAAGDMATFVSEGSGNWRCTSYQRAASEPVMITPWVAYTPTFTGFGTVSGVSFYSRRVGDSLEVRGTFVSGTSTATEARITLGYNGTNANVTVANTSKIPVRSTCGTVVFNLSTAATPSALVEQSTGYLLIGLQSASTNGYQPANGSSVASSGVALSINASVPISGW